MSIQLRIQMVMKMHNLSPSAFADKIGVQRSNISHILNGRNKPSIDMLEKILSNFHRVNAHWLITGQMPTGVEALETRAQGTELETPKIEGLNSNQLNIDRIVTFYMDGTFEVHVPKH